MKDHTILTGKTRTASRDNAVDSPRSPVVRKPFSFASCCLKGGEEYDSKIKIDLTSLYVLPSAACGG